MKTPTIPTLLGPDGMTSLREYAGYHGGGSGFGGQFRSEDIRDERESVGNQRRILKNGCRIVRQFGGVIGIIGVCFKR